jgi:hypothetical protein
MKKSFKGSSPTWGSHPQLLSMASQESLQLLWVQALLLILFPLKTVVGQPLVANAVTTGASGPYEIEEEADCACELEPSGQPKVSSGRHNAELADTMLTHSEMKTSKLKKK